MPSVSCSRFSLALDESGAFRCLEIDDQEIILPGLAPRIMLAGQPVFLRSVSESDGGLALSLAGDGCAGVLRMVPRGDRIRCTIDIEGADPYDLVQIELGLPPPPLSALHIPTSYTYGHVIDADSPLGKDNGILLRGRRYQFCAAELAGRVLSFVGYSTLERIPRRSFGTVWRIGGYVAQDALWFQMACLTGMDWELAFDDTLAMAIARCDAHLRNDYGAIPWREDSTVPDWFHDLKMVVTLDMYRSNGDVAHDYRHLRDLCREMKAAGMGGGVLFYLPGHNNRYDAGFPLYGPNNVLGGPAGFREMVEAIHDAGHHVTFHNRMLPCHPEESAPPPTCGFRFRLRFEEGVNQVRLNFTDGMPDLSRATVRVYDGVHPPAGESITRKSHWTHPHVRMDLRHPHWIEVVRDQLVKLVQPFDVDAVHIDAAVIDTVDLLPIYAALREALPATLFGCEYLAELNYRMYHITQNANLPEPGPHRVTDLSYRLNEPYLKFYYHLCATDGFVPVATVCDHRPAPEQMPEWRRERVERMWREGPQWNILPNVRLNYRDYGLDPRTRDSFFEVLGQASG